MIPNYALAYDNPIANDIWKDKYRYTPIGRESDEQKVEDSLVRMVRGVYAKDADVEALRDAAKAVVLREFIPAGRIQAGAGTDKTVTLINCYVNEDIEDSMPGIMHALTGAALTMQQGGGIGTDFTTIRPNGALVRSTGSVSSGVLPFMDMQDAMCITIRSSGSRRGAMMGTLADWHPDILDFIEAKTKQGRLTNFNVSVLVSDAFMQAVEEDDDWHLGFGVPRADGEHAAVLDVHPAFEISRQEIGRRMANMREDDGSKFYVYRTIRARELWEKIIRLSYEYAEPGVLFIDRINAMNNLQYCEYIHCTNPCGEQPLPPHNVCDLGSVNLALLVRDPFTPEARVDFLRLNQLAGIAVRLLDNVLDVTRYPLEAQRKEALSKRRIGVGVTGLGNMLQMMGLRYGSAESVALVDRVMAQLSLACYRASALLAKERGPFPLYSDDILDAPFVRRLIEAEVEYSGAATLEDLIRRHGLRNGVILSIAPTGTISLAVAGNCSSGLEPTFSFRPMTRKVLQADNETHKVYEVKDFGYHVYETIHGPTPHDRLPEYMVGAMQLSVEEHLAIQTACQKWVDSSISKTINCPSDMPYEDFAEVYTTAYRSGLKGCTTYRPSGVRGSVLAEVEPTPAPVPAPVATEAPAVPVPGQLLSRPPEVAGYTYKLDWPATPHAFYVTINHVVDGAGRARPIEIFINTKSVEHQEWITALTRTLSAVFRRESDSAFLVEELTQVFSPRGGFFIGKGYVPSLVALIGKTIQAEFARLDLVSEPSSAGPEESSAPAPVLGEFCPQCQNPTMVRIEGCSKCVTCGHSTCGG